MNKNNNSIANIGGKNGEANKNLLKKLKIIVRSKCTSDNLTSEILHKEA